MSENIQVIVKLVEKCNLNCNYCYMYEGADQSWRTRPTFLSIEHREKLITRCKEYLAEDAHRTLTLEFHGGEPLLLGKRRFTEFVAQAREALGEERASFCIQTNGTILDQEWCELFMQYGVSWSISSDGPPKSHDRFRKYHNGKPSSTHVERAIQISLDTQSPLYGGVLAVIDPDANASELVQYFYDLGVRQLDLLLPDANHINAPGHLSSFNQAQLHQYLKDGYDRWTDIGDPSFRIRIFEEMMRGLFGVSSNLDAFGGELWGLFVVESDGSYQKLDVLRIGGESEVDTGLNIARDSIDKFLINTSEAQPPACETCQSCDAFKVCGGGYLPHRFDGQSYDQPSVHCESLYQTINHIKAHVQRSSPQQMWAS